MQFICKLQNFEFDPFDPRITNDIFAKYVLRNNMRTFRLWLIKKIVRHFDIDEPFSETTVCHKVDVDNNIDIVEALEDTRSETFGLRPNINMWAYLMD